MIANTLSGRLFGVIRRARDPTPLRSFAPSLIFGVQTATALREPHRLRWGAKPSTSMMGFPEGWGRLDFTNRVLRKVVLGVGPVLRALLMIIIRLNGRRQNEPQTRLSYFTVRKFQIVVETRRNRPRIVRNRCAPGWGYRTGCFGFGLAQLWAQIWFKLKDFRRNP